MERGRAKAALSQPTVQLSREHINTSRCATQGALLLHWVANAVLIASSGESARSGADVPPEKTAGGRERNQPHTGVREFPWLKKNSGASGDEDGQDFSDQTAPSPSQNDPGQRHHCFLDLQLHIPSGMENMGERRK